MDGYSVGSIRVLYRSTMENLGNHKGSEVFCFANFEFESVTHAKKPGPKRSHGLWSTGSVEKRGAVGPDARRLSVAPTGGGA